MNDPLSTTDDENIVAFLKGDQRAFNALYERHSRVLLSIINGYVQGDFAMADDIFQQTWIHIIDKLSAYQQQNYFLAWACTIARHLTINTLRKKKKLKTLFIQDSTEFLEELPDEQDETNILLERDISIESVNEALERLNPLQKEVVLLRQSGLSFNQIAEVQSTSLNTALGRHHDAIKHMRNWLNINTK